MPEQMHEALVIALGHKNINVISENYSGGISKSGEYTPAWLEGMCDAQAEFKVAASPYAIRNNNCQVCEDPTPPTCIPVSGTLSLPDAAVGTPYSASITLTGDAPFDISSIVKPGWMTVDVSGSNVNFTGTPSSEESGTGIVVSFTLSNCSGANTLDLSDTIDVTDCISVAIAGSPALPDGFSGVPYSYSLGLSGTGPFTLGAVTKPAWMTIGISGSSVNFTGTPDVSDEGTAIGVDITVNNDCGSAPFADAFDITSPPPPVTLTITTVPTGGGPSAVSIVATLSGAVDADITMNLVQTLGYTSPDCSGSSSASTQVNDMLLASGNTTVNGNDLPAGDWSSVDSFSIITANINGVARLDGDVFTVGSFTVTIIIDGC